MASSTVGKSILMNNKIMLFLFAIILLCHTALASFASASTSASVSVPSSSSSGQIVSPSLSLSNNNSTNNIISQVETKQNSSSNSSLADNEDDEEEEEEKNIWAVEDTAKFQQKFHVGNGRIFNDNEVKIIEFLMQSYTSNFVLANNLTTICPQLLYLQHQQPHPPTPTTPTTTTTTTTTNATSWNNNNTTTTNNTNTNATAASTTFAGRAAVPISLPSSSELQEIIDDTISCECTVNSIVDEIPPPPPISRQKEESSGSSSSSSSSSSITATLLHQYVHPSSSSTVGTVSDYVTVVTYAARYESFICNMRHYTYLFQQYVNGHRETVMDDLQKLGLDITGVEMATRIVYRIPASSSASP